MALINKYFRKNDYLMSLIIIFLVLFLIFITSGTLFAGYHFIDEHTMISINHDLQNKNFAQELLKETVGEFFGGREGRFRPFFIFHLYIESKLFGIDRFLWSFYTGVLIAITAYFLFIFARLIDFSFKLKIILYRLVIIAM